MLLACSGVSGSTHDPCTNDPLKQTTDKHDAKTKYFVIVMFLVVCGVVVVVLAIVCCVRFGICPCRLGCIVQLRGTKKAVVSGTTRKDSDYLLPLTAFVDIFPDKKFIVMTL